MSTASEAVFNANRINAQSSTGPTSDAGKQRSSQNATKHGMYAKFAILPDDDPAQFDALKQEIIAELLPQNDPEQRIVHDIAESTWRLHRLIGFESSTLFVKSQIHLEPLRAQFPTQSEAVIRQLARATVYADNRLLFNQITREEKRLRALVETLRQQLDLTPQPEPDELNIDAAQDATPPQNPNPVRSKLSRKETKRQTREAQKNRHNGR